VKPGSSMKVWIAPLLQPCYSRHYIEDSDPYYER
jgi:hypothetical protein